MKSLIVIALIIAALWLASQPGATKNNAGQDAPPICQSASGVAPNFQVTLLIGAGILLFVLFMGGLKSSNPYITFLLIVGAVVTLMLAQATGIYNPAACG